MFPYLQVSQSKPACIYLLPARKLTHTYDLQNITERVKTLEQNNKVWGLSFLAKFQKCEIYIHTLKVFVLVLAWVIEKGFKENQSCFKKDMNVFRTMRSFDKCPPKWASLSSIRERISNKNLFRPKNYINGFENNDKYWQISTVINKTAKMYVLGQKINCLLLTDKYHTVWFTSCAQVNKELDKMLQLSI